ncbi:trophoblast glycoprotein b [Triplophysa rosa]|uniref:Trophoblast glycoprotein n=1 Tax=Triplophysa rosa TaxID=992332 RepID=A0A9W7T5N1_TRIRA|nr:trophoblast glycoprotein b [Triplophysa rosa]KAI7790373.1 trophoblast glycoprotein precursor [Triplophysa rosa]
MCNLTLCVLLFLAASSSSSCPVHCVCETTIVNCVNQGLRSIPQPLPKDITTLNINGNDIRNLNNESFPSPLEHLTSLYVSGSQVEQLNTMVFANLPSLRFLDLSNNIIVHFSAEAFSQDNKVEVLNLSRSLYNYSYVGVFANLFKQSLPKVSHLDLSNNKLVLLPEGTFTGLLDLTVLDLRNNSLVSIMNGTFQNRALEELDLRDNALKDLPNGTLADLCLIPDLRVRLAGNPWRCDCNIEDMLIWLKRYDLVVDKLKITCSAPAGLKHVSLLQLKQYQLPCTYTGDLKGVLETSYVFLGMVLALIGVIFLLVLYLNRKGIKRWIYNIRDACRDHMEGYHYRYEINSDPRLANLSLNSDV